MFRKSNNEDLIALAKMVIAAAEENAILRQVCQCRDCKHYYTVANVCRNEKSLNYKESMYEYSSCKSCER